MLICSDGPILGGDLYHANHLTPSLDFSLAFSTYHHLVQSARQLGRVEDSFLVVMVVCLGQLSLQAGRRMCRGLQAGRRMLMVQGLLTMFDVIPSLGILRLLLEALSSLGEPILVESIGILWGFRPQSRCCRQSASNLVVVLQAVMGARAAVLAAPVEQAA